VKPEIRRKKAKKEITPDSMNEIPPPSDLISHSTPKCKDSEGD
jgi:hypothetical protein